MSETSGWSFSLTAVLIVSFLIGAIAGGWFYSKFLSPSGSAAVVVENTSSSLVTQGKVTGCGREFTFSDLSPDEYVVFTHVVDCESGHTVQVQTEQGKELESRDIYVSFGFSQVDFFEVREDGVVYDKERSRQRWLRY